MKFRKLIPALAILFALAVLAFTFYKHMTVPEEAISTFTPPEVKSEEPVIPWDIGVEIVTPIA